jgi:hypothetical protein
MSMKRMFIPSLALALIVFGVPTYSFAAQIPECSLLEGAGQIQITFGTPTVTSTSINLNAPTAGKIKNVTTLDFVRSFSVNWTSGNNEFSPQNARTFFNATLMAGQSKPPTNPANLLFTGLTPGTSYSFYFANDTTGDTCPVFKITTLGQPVGTNQNTVTNTNTSIQSSQNNTISTVQTNPSTQPPQKQTTTTTTTQTQQTSSTSSSAPEPAPYNPTLLSNPLKPEYNTIPNIITAVIQNILIPLTLPFLVIAFIWSGFLFVSARGNQEKLKKAKEAFGWTVAGAAVILGAFVIARAIQNTIEQVRGTAMIEVVHEERIARND